MSTGRQRIELVAVLVAQHLQVRGERRRVARDVDDPRGAELAGSAERLPASPARGGSTTTTSGPPACFAKLLDRLADVPGEEARVLDAVELGVLDRARDGLLRDLEAPHGAGAAREREADRPGPAVEVEHVLVSRQRRVLACELVEPLRHLRVRLQERRRADAEPQSEDLLLDRVVAPEELRREVRLLGRGVVDRPVDRPHLLGSAEGRPPGIPASNRSPGAVTSTTSACPVLRPSRDDEVAQVALYPVAWSYGSSPLLASPVANGEADRVPEVGRQEALLDPDHLVPAPRTMEPEIDPVLALRERVLELVPVAVLRRWPARSARAAARRTARCGRARPAPGAPSLRAAPRRRDPGSGSRRTRRSAGTARHTRTALGRSRRLVTTPSAKPRFVFVTRARTSSPGTTAANEHDEAVVARDAVPAVGERVDAELELLSLVNGRGH